MLKNTLPKKLENVIIKKNYEFNYNAQAIYNKKKLSI
jgi:hypothetical protein